MTWEITRRVLAALIALAYINCVVGCTSTYRVPCGELARPLPKKRPITAAILSDSTKVKFATPPGGDVDWEHRTISGFRFTPHRSTISRHPITGEPIKLSLDDLSAVEMRKNNDLGTVLILTGIVAVAIGIYAATWLDNYGDSGFFGDGN